MKKIFLLLILPTVLFAQVKVSINGYLHDKATGEPLPFANVMLKNTQIGGASNVHGYYVINEDELRNMSFYETHEVSNGEHWDTISYNLYKSPYLWWIIALINKDMIKNPFEDLSDGDELTVLRDDFVYQLLSDLEKIAED